MKILFDEQNRLTVTATNREEASVLLGLVYKEQEQGSEHEIKMWNSSSAGDKHDYPKTKKKRKYYSKKCPVAGCHKKSRNIGVHMLKAHGITGKGLLVPTYTFNKKEYTCPQPAVRDGKGGYKLKGYNSVTPKTKTNYLSSSLGGSTEKKKVIV